MYLIILRMHVVGLPNATFSLDTWRFTKLFNLASMVLTIVLAIGVVLCSLLGTADLDRLGLLGFSKVGFSFLTTSKDEASCYKPYSKPYSGHFLCLRYFVFAVQHIQFAVAYVVGRSQSRSALRPRTFYSQGQNCDASILTCTHAQS